MLIIILILIIVIVFLSIRLFTISGEIKNINRQLASYNDLKTEKKIDINLIDKHIETLGSEINRLMDHYVNSNREKIRSDNELKKAVANISHDLRTPLTSIKGYLQMIESSNLTEGKRHEYLSIAIERSKHLEHLINDFFELSTIESPDYKLNEEQINLSQLVNEAVLSFYSSFKDVHIEPGIDIEMGNVFIDSDRDAVWRVLENLLSNAIRYSDGEVSVSLKKHGDYVHISIKNSTRLTAKEMDLELFFDRFYIADQSRTHQSTGLGLPIVKSLMEKMDGKIKASYEKEKLTLTCIWRLAD